MTEARKWEEKEDRFKELVLYISQKCATDPKFNTIKLNKLMFFSDFFAYGIFGAPITGFEYQKLQLGPAPRRMPEIRNQMVENRELGLQELPLQPWRRTVNLRRPDLSLFDAEQISLVDSLIEEARDMDGDTLSSASHQMPCWIVPDLNCTIPYEMVFLSHDKTTSVDVERGRVVAESLGLIEHTQHHAAP